MKRIDSITVIIPIYDGLAETRRCIDSVLASRCERHFHTVLVYDAGPEPALLEYVQQVAARETNIELLINRENLGFVKSVNRALRHREQDDVVILNSDTVVPPTWLDKLAALAESDPSIGTITPMSSNAEIFSFPHFCKINDVPEDHSTELIDRALEEANPLLGINAPTGVGFCMYIRREALNKVGFFDEATFGRGYGEENDLCQRLARAGYNNVVSVNTWVHHEGGVSFGDQKARLIARHSEILRRRYPDYFPSVHRFIATDPLKSYRLRGIIRLLAISPRPLILMISHGLGGGTARHVAELTEQANGYANVLCLEPVDHNHLTLRLPDWLASEPLRFDTTNDMPLLLAILKAVQPALVHIHHIKGVERIVAHILSQLDAKHLVTLHDFYLIAANPTLTNDQGVFESQRAVDPVLMSRDLERVLDMGWDDWRKLTRDILFQATQVIAPSPSTAAIYRQQYPDLPITVADHPDAEQFGEYPAVTAGSGVSNEPVSVLAIGALGKEKGADLLEQVALLAKARGINMRFHLLGYAYRPLNQAVVVHGAYRDTELRLHIKEIAPDFIWFPCLWPETYSYTLSAVLESGLPVIGPDLGALSDRITKRPLSRTVAHGTQGEQWLAKLESFATELRQHAGSTLEWLDQPARTAFYGNEYPGLISARGAAPDPAGIPSIEALSRLLDAQPPSAKRIGEQIVRFLVIVRDLPGIRAVSSLIPIRAQRTVKRMFMRGPVHDIL